MLEPAPHRPDLSSRLSAISQKTDILAAEDQKIANFRSSAGNQKIRDDEQYSKTLTEIDNSKRTIAELKRRIAGSVASAKDAQRSLEKAKRDLENAKKRLEAVRTEEDKLTKAEKQMQEELSSLEEEFLAREREEIDVVEREKPIEIQEAELNALRKQLRIKNREIEERQERIRKIFADSDHLETELDKEIGRAQTEAEKNDLDSELSERHEIPLLRRRVLTAALSDSEEMQPLQSNSESLRSSPYQSGGSEGVKEESWRKRAVEDVSGQSVDDVFVKKSGGVVKESSGTEMSDVLVEGRRAIEMPVTSVSQLKKKVEEKIETLISEFRRPGSTRI
jgi:chromosome segregation ATPase